MTLKSFNVWVIYQVNTFEHSTLSFFLIHDSLNEIWASFGIFAPRWYNTIKRLPCLLLYRTDGSKPYCRRFNACKSSQRDGLVSPLNCVSAISKQLGIIAFCTRESAMIFWTARESALEARLKSYVNCCHISAGAHKFKSAVLASGVPFQKSTLKKLEHILPCKSSRPCPNLLARVPEFWSAAPKTNVV